MQSAAGRGLIRMLRAAVRGPFLAGSALLLALLLGLASPGVVHAQDVIVDDDGQAALPQNCGGSNSVDATIGGGVSTANAGETVFVCPGTYTENVTVDKSLTLKGNNAGTAGGGSRDPESIVDASSGSIGFDVATTGAVTVDGFQFEGDRGVVRNGGGNQSDQITIQNNRFRTNEFGVRLRDIQTGLNGGGITIAENFTDLKKQIYDKSGSEAGATGIALRTIDGSGSVTVEGNDFNDPDPSDADGKGSGWYGIVFDGVKVSSGDALITGGSSGATMKGLAQAIAILDGEAGEPLVNTNGGQTPDESDFAIQGGSGDLSASSFTGESNNGAISFHAGVFVYAGGEPGTQVETTGNITNITITGTGTANGTGNSSAGLYFGGFSTEFGSNNGNFDQTVTATNVTLQDNDNRGVYARGADVVATVTRSTISGSGDAPTDPANGNKGFGVIARKGADLTVRESTIANPASMETGFSSSDFGSALQSQTSEPVSGTPPVLTVESCKINRNGLGKLIDGSETVQASGNAWLDGSLITDAGTLTNFIEGSQNDYSPFLGSDTDTDGSTAGFQGDVSTLILDSGSADAPSQSATKIEEAIALGGSTELRLQTSGGEYAIPSDVTVPGNFVVDGDLDFTTGGGIITVTNGELAVAGGVSSITDSPTFNVRNRFEGESGTGNDTGWRILTSPRASTDGADLDDLDFSTNTGSILYTWDGATQSFVAGDNTASTSLPSGKGFFLYFFDDGTESVEPSSPITLDVQGTLTTGSPFESSDQFGTGSRNVDIPATPSGDDGGTGYVLGVPYAQSFDLSDLVLQGGGTIGTNGEFKGVVQAWDPTAGADGQFVQITEAGDNSDLIAPWQGFWLLRDQSTTTDQAETLVFESEGRSSGAPFIGRKAASVAESGRLAVELRLEDDGGTVLSDSRTTLYLRSGASVGPDAYDAARIEPPMDEYAQVSLVATDQTRQAQMSLPYELDQRVTRGLHAEAAGLSGTGVLTLPTWTNVPGGWTIKLTDTEADTTFALTEDTEYRFDLGSTKALSKSSDTGPSGGPQEGSVSGRFELAVVPKGALPVEMASFEGATVEEGVRLTWRTASEQNNARFQIQRKSGPARAGGDSAEQPSRRDGSGAEWETVGTVEGAGTTSRSQTYRFTDADVPYASETLRYRLRQVDTDGSASYSDPVTIERGGPEQVVLRGTYPNPARQRATMQFAVPTGTDAEAATLRLYDMLGRSVRKVKTEVEPGRHEQILDVSGLTSGVYVLQLQVGGTTKTQKLTIVQ